MSEMPQNLKILDDCTCVKKYLTILFFAVPWKPSSTHLRNETILIKSPEIILIKMLKIFVVS